MKRIIPAVVILLVSSFVFVVNFPFKVSRSIVALEVILGDPIYSKNKEIIMNGTYYVNLFSPDKFSGEIMVIGYERDYQGFEMVDCDVSAKGSSLIWEQKSGKNIDAKVFGTIFSDRFFNNFTILIGSSHDLSNSICVVTNAETAEIAIKIAEKIFSETKE